MPTATITSKGQITIPIEVRRKLGLKTGDKINIFDNGDGKFTFQPKTGSIMDMEGILQRLGIAPLGYAPSIEEMDQAVLDLAVQLDRATMSHADSSEVDDKVA
jgi:AbrB family looped-hinge helix DNA binding protein